MSQSTEYDIFFEIAYDVWVNHIEDLLDERDSIWQDRIILTRDEIQEYLDKYPERVSQEQLKAIEKSDTWLISHIDHRIVRKVIEYRNEKPDMKYWWRNVGTILEKRREMEEGSEST